MSRTLGRKVYGPKGEDYSSIKLKPGAFTLVGGFRESFPEEVVLVAKSVG